MSPFYAWLGGMLLGGVLIWAFGIAWGWFCESTTTEAVNEVLKCDFSMLNAPTHVVEKRLKKVIPQLRTVLNATYLLRLLQLVHRARQQHGIDCIPANELLEYVDRFMRGQGRWTTYELTSMHTIVRALDPHGWKKEWWSKVAELQRSGPDQEMSHEQWTEWCAREWKIMLPLLPYQRHEDPGSWQWLVDQAAANVKLNGLIRLYYAEEYIPREQLEICKMAFNTHGVTTTTKLRVLELLKDWDGIRALVGQMPEDDLRANYLNLLLSHGYEMVPSQTTAMSNVETPHEQI